MFHMSMKVRVGNRITRVRGDAAMDGSGFFPFLYMRFGRADKRYNSKRDAPK